MPTRVFTKEELEATREAVGIQAEVLSNMNWDRRSDLEAHYNLLSRALDVLWGFSDDTGETFEPHYSECSVCHGPIERFAPPGAVFWSHFDHPADEHDAVPV